MDSEAKHPGAAAGKPRLRLVGTPPEAARPAPRRRAGPLADPLARRTAERSPAARHAAPQPAEVRPVLAADDPRWVLALRVAESLEGTTLAPAKRARLIEMGRKFGLTAFDANLVIAVVQDQARRGHRPEVCPRMGEPQLRMIAAPDRDDATRTRRARRWLRVGLIVAVLSAMELLALWLILGR